MFSHIMLETMTLLLPGDSTTQSCLHLGVPVTMLETVTPGTVCRKIWAVGKTASG